MKIVFHLAEPVTPSRLIELLSLINGHTEGTTHVQLGKDTIWVREFWAVDEPDQPEPEQEPPPLPVVRVVAQPPAGEPIVDLEDLDPPSLLEVGHLMDPPLGSTECDRCPHVAKSEGGLSIHMAKVHGMHHWLGKQMVYCRADVTCNQLLRRRDFPSHMLHQHPEVLVRLRTSAGTAAGASTPSAS